MSETKPLHCELCQRPVPYLTRHHLVPRTRHRKKSARRRFSMEFMQQHILWVCRPCHNHIHRVFSEKQLETEYHSREALLAHQGITRFTNWLGSKPAGFKPISSKRQVL